jgi:hypothetical protein
MSNPRDVTAWFEKDQDTTTTSTTTTAYIAPQLDVSPARLDFASDNTTLQLRLANIGQGALDWYIDREAAVYDDKDSGGWIFSITPTAGVIQLVPQAVSVTVSRLGLSAGFYTGIVPVSSTAGNEDIDVSVDVVAPEVALPVVMPRFITFFGNTRQQELKIVNRLNGTLVWECEVPNYSKESDAGWLTVSPGSGTVTDGAAVLCATVDSTDCRPGLHFAVIPIRTNVRRITVPVILWKWRQDREKTSSNNTPP